MGTTRIKFAFSFFLSTSTLVLFVFCSCAIQKWPTAAMQQREREREMQSGGKTKKCCLLLEDELAGSWKCLLNCSIEHLDYTKLYTSTERDFHYARWKKAVQRTMKWEVTSNENEGKQPANFFGWKRGFGHFKFNQNRDYNKVYSSK